jgi:hypothetical protein
VITNNTRKIKNRIFAAAETHRSNIMRKLGFHSIRDLVVYAVKNNIIQVQVPTHLQSPTEGSAAWHPKAVAVNAGGGKGSGAAPHMPQQKRSVVVPKRQGSP